MQPNPFWFWEDREIGKIRHKYFGVEILDRLQIWSSALIGVKIVNLGSVIVGVKIESRP